MKGCSAPSSQWLHSSRANLPTNRKQFSVSNVIVLLSCSQVMRKKRHMDAMCLDGRTGTGPHQHLSPETGYSTTALNWSDTTLPFSMMKPRDWTDWAWNSHFSTLINNLFPKNLYNTSQRAWCSEISLEKVRMLSRYTRTKQLTCHGEHLLRKPETPLVKHL